ncbi:MAG: ComF family protein [Planctomycetota bacterium]
MPRFNIQSFTPRWAENVSLIRGQLHNFFWPPECPLCEELVSDPVRLICERCTGLMKSDYSRCSKCAGPVPEVVEKDQCYRCRKADFRFDRVITLGPYRDHLSDAVIRLKKPSQWLLRNSLAGLLAEAVTDALDHTLAENGEPESRLLIPIPNYWTHAFQGVADTAGELARTMAAESGIPLKTNLIRRTRKTAKQGMLSRTERSKNVRGAFQIPSPESLTGCHVILVDDVLTSGATCSEVARQLKSAGASTVTVAVIARGTGARESPTPQNLDV